MKNFKNIILFLIVACLSILHVHCSINTASNAANPATLILMLLVSMRIEDEVITFYAVQSLVTIVMAWFILKWKNVSRWAFAFIAVLWFAITLNHDFWAIYHRLEEHPLMEIYYNFYNYEQAFIYGVVCTSLQIMLLASYLFLNYVGTFSIYRKMKRWLMQQWDICRNHPLYREYKYQIILALILLLGFVMMLV
jgi:hypothetical protein